jgi:hypothetical protein
MASVHLLGCLLKKTWWQGGETSVQEQDNECVELVTFAIGVESYPLQLEQ